MNNQQLFILIGTIFMFLMGLFLIAFVAIYQQRQLKLKIQQQQELRAFESKMQQKMLENSLAVQETEQRRIAKDLHDDVGAMLSTTKMSLNQLIRKIDNVDDLRTLSQQTKEFLEESISQVRRIARELVPRTLEDFGLVLAIDEYINKLHTSFLGIDFSFDFEGIGKQERIDNKIELTLYRIMQELVNNALKHANATKIMISVVRKDNKIIFTFSDNGKGFDVEKAKKDINSGLGLQNIESRLSVINGKVKFSSTIGQGSVAVVNVNFE